MAVVELMAPLIRHPGELKISFGVLGKTVDHTTDVGKDTGKEV